MLKLGPMLAANRGRKSRRLAKPRRLAMPWRTKKAPLPEGSGALIDHDT
jgi:hypothetical protein